MTPWPSRQQLLAVVRGDLQLEYRTGRPGVASCHLA